MPDVSVMIDWKRQIEPQIIDIDGVTSISVRDDGITIYVDDDAPIAHIREQAAVVPAHIPVNIEVMEMDCCGYTDKVRPVPGGVRIWAPGALGSAGLPMNDGDANYMVTASHVTGECFDGSGTDVGQPNEDHIIGFTTRDQEFTSDAAVGDFTAIRLSSSVGAIPEIYNVSGELGDSAVQLSLNDTVTKSGYRTGVSSGPVTDLDVTVDYSSCDQYKTQGLMMARLNVNSGDSGGSVVVEDGGTLYPAGIVSGRGETSGGTVYLIFTPATEVARQFSDLQWGVKSTDEPDQPDEPDSPDPNKAPTARMSTSPINPTTDDVITFDATQSEDPDGNIARYEWSIGHATRSGATYETYLSAGDWNISLTVEDDQGATDSVGRTLTVTEPSDGGGGNGDGGGDQQPDQSGALALLAVGIAMSDEF